MYKYNVEADEINPLSTKYSVFEAPYTDKKTTMGEWAYYAIKCISEQQQSYEVAFSNGEANNIGNPYEAFVDMLGSYYDNTWSGMSMDYINKLYGSDEVLPTRFVNYPLMRSKIDWMRGRFESSPVDLNMSAIDKESVEKKIRVQSHKLFLKLMLPFIEGLEKTTGTQLEKDKTIPPDIEKYARYTYKQVHEINMSKLILYNFHKHSWFNQFASGFQDMALYGFTFLKLNPSFQDDVLVKKPNLKNVMFDWGCECDFGSDAMYLGERRRMTFSQVQKEYNVEKVWMDEIKGLAEKNNGYANDPNMVINGHQTSVDVIDLLLKASTPKKFKKVPNKHREGAFIYKVLKSGEEENEKKLKKDNAEIVTIEKYDWYHVVLIEDNIVVKAEPIWAPRKHEELVDVVNPFTAFLFNRNNGYKPNGMGELIKSAQDLFNLCISLVELEIATSPGNVVEYDVRFKPKNVSLTNVFYHMRANKLIQVDKSKAGSNGNMFNQVNLQPNGATIYLNIAMFVEQFIDRLTGITPMAQGQVPNDTYAATLDRAVEQANFTTKPYYTFYREGLRRTMKSAAAMLKELNKGKKRTLSIVIPEVGIDFFQIEGDIPYGEYDFFFNDGTEAEQKRKMLINLAQAGMSAGAVTFKQVKDLIMIKDLNEASGLIDKALEEFDQKQAQAQEIEQALRQEENMKPERLAQLKGQIDLLIKQQSGADQKEVATIYAREKMKQTILEKEIDQE